MTGGEITTHDKVLATREDRAKKGQDLCDRTRSGSWPKWNERCFPTVSVEDYIHDTLQVVELNRVQGVGHLDMSVAVLSIATTSCVGPTQST